MIDITKFCPLVKLKKISAKCAACLLQQEYSIRSSIYSRLHSVFQTVMSLSSVFSPVLTFIRNIIFLIQLTIYILFQIVHTVLVCSTLGLFKIWKIKIWSPIERAWHYLVADEVDEWIRELQIVVLMHQFEDIEDVISNNPDFKKRKQFKFLEIGPGLDHFCLYPSGTHLTIVDKNPKHNSDCTCIQDAVNMYPEIKQVKIIDGDCRNMSEVPSDSIDFVIVNHVFCCMKDWAAALKEIHRVLQPDGMFYVSQGVNHPKGTWKNWWHRFCHPIASAIVGPKCPSEILDADDLEQKIEEAGFEIQYYDFQNFSVFRSHQKLLNLPFEHRFLYAMATKQD